jgi:hypothetical protein
MDAEQAVETPDVERQVALDLARRGALIAPVVIIVAGLIAGWDGVLSAAIALAIVLLNFLAAAAIMTRAAKSGPGALGAAAAGGFAVRMAVILIALVVLHNQPWIDMPVFGIVLVGSVLGLLFWEMKYVSLTLAAPGLRPARPSGDQ